MALPSPRGVPGTTAPSGFLQTRDRNSALRWPLAGGTPSTVGEYAHLAATDPTIASCLSAMVLPIARGEWTIGRDDVDEAIADFVEDELFERLAPDFRDVVRETARAMLTSGFHVAEPVLRRRDDGLVGLASLAPRPAWTISRVIYDSDGTLEALEQSAPAPDGTWTTVILPVESLLIWTHEREGNDPTGKSQIRPCVRAAKTRDLLHRLIAVRNEREALGLPIGTYPATATDAQRDDFETALAQYRAHERGYLMIPEGFTVAIPEGRAGSSDAIRADAAYLTTEIQSAFLQAWQSLGREGSSSGGRAVGETQAGPFYLALEAVMAEIAGPLDALIRRLVDLNFGPQDHYPYIVCPKLRADDVLASVLPILEAIKAGGVTADAGVEGELRERLSLPEAVAAPTAPVAPFSPAVPPEDDPPPTGGGTRPPAEDVADEEAVLPSETEEPEAMRAADPGAVALAWLPPRSLTPSELRVAFGEMSARFDASPADLQATIGDTIRRQRKAILRWLRPMAAGMARGDAAAFERLAKSDFPREVRAAIVEAVRRHAADAFAFGRAQAERERRKAGRGAVDPAPLEPVTMADPTEPPTDAVDPATAAEAAIFGDRITDELLRVARLAATRAAANQVRLVPGTIPLVDEITNAVVDAVEELAVSSAAVKEAAIAVSVRAVSGGRREVFDEDEDQIASVEYSAVMDSNTCGVCGEWDGKIAPSLVAADEILPGTPNNDCEGTASRCRCIWVVDYK